MILPSASLVGMLFVWNALVVMQQPFGYMLAGLSEVRRVTLYSVSTAVTSIVLMFVLGPRFGLFGIVAGLIVAICISLDRLRFGGAAFATFDFVRVRSTRPATGLPTVLSCARVIRRTLRSLLAQP